MSINEVRKTEVKVVHNETLIAFDEPKEDWKKPKAISDADKFKQYDLLTLKKLVIEEIKSELELAGHGKNIFPGVSRPGYVDPFTRRDQVGQPGDKIQITGQQRKVEQDEDGQIIINTRKAQA